MIKLELEKMMMDTEFVRVEIDCGDESESVWQGVKFKYFTGGQYYLPIVRYK